MGCQSGKVTPPKLSAPEPAILPIDQHTLLTTSAATNGLKAQVLSGQATDPFASSFDGPWTSGAIIRDNGPLPMTRRSSVTWSDGSVSSARIDDKTRTISITYEGAQMTGELRDDECIHWSDGDIWARNTEENMDCAYRPPTSQDAVGSAAAQSQDGGSSTAVDVLTVSHRDVELVTPKIAENPAATCPDSKPPQQLESRTGINVEVPPKVLDAHKWASKSPGGMDRISIDTVDLDQVAAGTVGVQAISGKAGQSKRKERSLCCC